MFGKEQDLHFITSDHCCIPLYHHCKISNEMSKFNQERTILFNNNLASKSVKERGNVTLKLRKQFSHLRSCKLKQFLTDGGVNNKEFLDML